MFLRGSVHQYYLGIMKVHYFIFGVYIDLKPAEFENSSALGKCSRQWHLYLSDFETNIDTGRAKGELVSKLVELSSSNYFYFFWELWF